MNPCLDFAKNLSKIYPKFNPINSLYLDFEGGWNLERILSLYWPKNNKSERFQFLWRGYKEDNELSTKGLLNILKNLNGFDTVKFVVVFSSGGNLPEEKNRFDLFFDKDIFPRNVEWVNMHYVLKTSKHTKQLIRRNAWAKFKKDKKRIRYSLENLENIFGINRQPEIRSHSNIYADNKKGLMSVLNLEEKYYKSGLNIRKSKNLLNYCKYDVQSMYEILNISSVLN